MNHIISHPRHGVELTILPSGHTAAFCKGTHKDTPLGPMLLPNCDWSVLI